MSYFHQTSIIQFYRREKKAQSFDLNPRRGPAHGLRSESRAAQTAPWSRPAKMIRFVRKQRHPGVLCVCGYVVCILAPLVPAKDRGPHMSRSHCLVRDRSRQPAPCLCPSVAYHINCTLPSSAHPCIREHATSCRGLHMMHLGMVALGLASCRVNSRH